MNNFKEKEYTFPMHGVVNLDTQEELSNFKAAYPEAEVYETPKNIDGKSFLQAVKLFRNLSQVLTIDSKENFKMRSNQEWTVLHVTEEFLYFKLVVLGGRSQDTPGSMYVQGLLENESITVEEEDHVGSYWIGTCKIPLY